MQFFDLSRQFNLNNIITPCLTLKDLEQHEWFLAKVRIEYDCLTDSELIKGQAIIKSSQHIQIELEWLLEDTGHELHIKFIGIDSPIDPMQQTDLGIVIKGAQLVTPEQQTLSLHTLILWLDGTLLPMLPRIRQEIKDRLNLWDYVTYDG